MVDVDPIGVDPECGEAVPLGSEVLVGCGDPGVADLESGHPSSVPYDVPERDFKADGSVGTGALAPARVPVSR